MGPYTESNGKASSLDCAELRFASRNVGTALDGTMAVRHEGRYLPFELCEPGLEDEPVKPQPKQRKSNRQAGQPGSNWNQNFDLKNSPPMWRAAPSSGRRKEETD